MKSAHSFFVLLLFFAIPFSAVSQTANSPTITSDQNLAIAVKDYCHRQALDKLFTEVPAQALPVRPLYQSLAAAKHEGDPLPSPLPFSLESFFVAEGNASVQPICIDHLSPRHFASDIVLRLVVEGAGVILKVYPIPPTEEDNEAIYAVTVRPGTTASSARSALFYQIFTKPRDEETPFAPAGAVNGRNTSPVEHVAGIVTPAFAGFVESAAEKSMRLL